MADVIIGARDAGKGVRLHKSLVRTDRYPLAFTTGVTVKSYTINVCAILHTAILEMPAFSGANPTATFSIENPDSVEIYSEDDSGSGLAEDADHVMKPDVALIGDNTVKVTLSTNPLSSGIAYVSLVLKGD